MATTPVTPAVENAPEKEQALPIPESLQAPAIALINTLAMKTAKGGQAYKSASFETPNVTLGENVACQFLRVSVYAWKVGAPSEAKLSKSASRAVNALAGKDKTEIQAAIDALMAKL